MRKAPVRGARLNFRVLPYQALLAPLAHHLHDLLYRLGVALGPGQAVVVAEAGRRTARWIFAPQLVVARPRTAAGGGAVVVQVMSVMMASGRRRQVRDVIVAGDRSVVVQVVAIGGEIGYDAAATTATGQMWVQDGRGNCRCAATSHRSLGGTVLGLLLTGDYFVLTIRHGFVAVKQPGEEGGFVRVVVKDHSQLRTCPVNEGVRFQVLRALVNGCAESNWVTIVRLVMITTIGEKAIQIGSKIARNLSPSRWKQ